jgi:hypothetical protein
MYTGKKAAREEAAANVPVEPQKRKLPRGIKTAARLPGLQTAE